MYIYIFFFGALSCCGQNENFIFFIFKFGCPVAHTRLLSASLWGPSSLFSCRPLCVWKLVGTTFRRGVMVLREGGFDRFLGCVNVVGDYMMMTIMTNRFLTIPSFVPFGPGR